jgi:hypothetical protein
MKPSRRREPIQINDYGTDRLRHHHKIKFELVSARSGQAMRTRVVDQTEIDRLYNEGILTQDEHSTAEKVRLDLWLIGTYGRPSSGMDMLASWGTEKMADGTADAMSRLHAAIRMLDREAGTKARRLFMSVLVDNRRVYPLDVPAIRACLAALLPLVERPRVPSLARLAKLALARG